MSLPHVITRYSLTARGKTSNPLIYLYPDIPKDQVFGKYSKESGIVTSVIFSSTFLLKHADIVTNRDSLLSVSVEPGAPKINMKEYVQRILTVTSE